MKEFKVGEVYRCSLAGTILITRIYIADQSIGGSTIVNYRSLEKNFDFFPLTDLQDMPYFTADSWMADQTKILTDYNSNIVTILYGK